MAGAGCYSTGALSNLGELEAEELQALERFAEGWALGDIGSALDAGPRTARRVLGSARERLGARSPRQAATMLLVLRRLEAGEAETEAV